MSEVNLRTWTRRRTMVATSLIPALIVGAWAAAVAGTSAGASLSSTDAPQNGAAGSFPQTSGSAPAATTNPSSLIRVSGPVPGRHDDLAYAEFDYSTKASTQDPSEFAANWPEARQLHAQDQSTFVFSESGGLRNSNGDFLAEAIYAAHDLRRVRVMSWNPTRELELFLPLRSIVHDVTERTINGHGVVVITLKASVEERRGMYRAYVEDGRTVHLIEAVDFSVRDDPSLDYALGSSPDSYVISGSGFEPGSVVRIIELPCGNLPCPSGGLAETDGIPVSADGTFSALLQASPGYTPSDGRVYRLIVATLSGVPWDLSSPSVRVPLHHQGSPAADTTPLPPPTGTGNADPSGVPSSVAFVLAGLAALGGGVVLLRMRRGA